MPDIEATSFQGQPASRSVFLSYRRLDDEPPPELPGGAGVVRYFWRQLRWELDRLGVPNAILWRDRGKISPADAFSVIIREELQKADLFIAFLSRATWPKPISPVAFS